MSHVPPNRPHVATVRTNFEGFSRKQVEGATAARRLMGMVVTPSPRDFEGMVRLNMLKDCPITNGDCVTTREKSDSGVNVKLKKKLTLLENYECLG